MAKSTYKHPDFVTRTDDLRIEDQNKRLWLSLEINSHLTDSLLVILKNPSQATKDISDKTVFTVTNYVHRNREKYPQFSNIGTIIILNLIPFYETYSELLAAAELNIIDKENLETIRAFTSRHKNVIIAWGNHPKGLLTEYEELKKETFDMLMANQNDVFYVDKLSKRGNPKHGQVWGYANELLPFNSTIINP